VYGGIALQAQPDGVDRAEDDGITGGSGVAHVWRQHCKGITDLVFKVTTNHPREISCLHTRTKFLLAQQSDPLMKDTIH
jgi:hypothetical protein